jgi:hypothetical protein
VTNSTESGEEDKGQRPDREWSRLQKRPVVEIALALLLAAANTIGRRLLAAQKLGT